MRPSTPATSLLAWHWSLACPANCHFHIRVAVVKLNEGAASEHCGDDYALDVDQLSICIKAVTKLPIRECWSVLCTDELESLMYCSRGGGCSPCQSWWHLRVLECSGLQVCGHFCTQSHLHGWGGSLGYVTEHREMRFYMGRHRAVNMYCETFSLRHWSQGFSTTPRV